MAWQPMSTAPKDETLCFLAEHWRLSNKDLWSYHVGYYLPYRRPKKKGVPGRWLINGTNKKVNPKYWQPIIPPAGE